VGGVGFALGAGDGEGVLVGVGVGLDALDGGPGSGCRRSGHRTRRAPTVQGDGVRHDAEHRQQDDGHDRHVEWAVRSGP
jgi:hypothetical protein